MLLPAEARRLLGVQEGDSLLLRVEQEGKATLIPMPASHADALAGIGADVGENVDPVEWQKEERKSWLSSQNAVTSESTQELIAEYLKIVATDDYINFDKLLTPDCKFSLMPAGHTWQGRTQVMAFVTSAGGSRRHDAHSKVTITNWFTDGEQLLVEYRHSALVGPCRFNVDGYCWVFHIRDGRFDVIREYINPKKFWLSILVTSALRMFPLLLRVNRNRNNETVAR